MPSQRHALAGLAAMLVGAAILYRFPPDQFAFYPRCPFHEFTRLLCPGCGGTRAVAALLHGDVMLALHWNALVVVTLPIVAGYVAMAWRQYRWPKLPNVTVATLLIVAIGFGVARNFV